MLLKSWYRGTEACYYSLNPPHRLMEQEEDYFAPFGMSQIDFNSMIRRRNLANLDRQLVEQGRVTLPGTLTVPSSNTARLVDVEHDAANAPEPLVADAELLRQLRHVVAFLAVLMAYLYHHVTL